MQCKYVFTYIPTWAPYKLLEVGKKKDKIIDALVKIQKYHIYWVIWEYYKKEKVSYVLFSKHM
jgi:hypothetical protein